jgi:hypothetical protein
MAMMACPRGLLWTLTLPSSCVNAEGASGRSALGSASESLKIMCTPSPVALSFPYNLFWPPIHGYHLINAPLQPVLDIPAKIVVIVGSAGREGVVDDEENEDSKCRKAQGQGS